MSRRFVGTVAAFAVVLLASGAAADPALDAGVDAPPAYEGHARIGSPSTLTTEAGTTLSLPAGVYVFSARAYDDLNAELRRLQDAETRLGAENASLRVSATSACSGSSWRVVVIAAGALAVGAGVGFWYGTR